jgi:membrane protein insertase Oxa1/YidC/SpoIIIJ
MILSKVDEAASTNFFFIIDNLYHIANQLYKNSCTSRTITSSQYHPRESRPLLGQPNLYKNCYTVFAYYEIVSYIARNESMFLLIHFFSFSYFFYLFFNFIYNMKWSQSICLFIFIIQLFLFPFLHFHI